jgi:hypothetical protein
MTLRHTGRSRLADHFEIADYGILDETLFHEGISPTHHIAFDRSNCCPQYVPDRDGQFSQRPCLSFYLGVEVTAEASLCHNINAPRNDTFQLVNQG